MSLISGISRYINNGYITLDSTRLPKRDVWSRLVRTADIGLSSFLGVVLSPASVVLGVGIGSYFSAVSVVRNIDLYFSNREASLCNLTLRIMCSILIETPCSALVLSSALFVDILTYYVRDIIYEQAEFNNYKVITTHLDNMVNFFNRKLNKKIKN